MRKQNSTFQTAFISEAGSELENNDYFAFVELEKYACYVIADGLNEQPDAESARLATQAIILAFQERPSLKKRIIHSYLEAANKALSETNEKKKLKASVTVVVTDYARARYGYVGNTRLRFYRNGSVAAQTKDMSLGTELIRKSELSEDVLARHEQRNNLYAYLGQGRHVCSIISEKIKLENGDIFALYTRGIWENLDTGELDDVFSEAKDKPQECLDNIEELLLSKQPDKLENYSFAAIFVDKVFLDPNRKRRIRKIMIISTVIFLLFICIVLLFYFLNLYRKRNMEEWERRYDDAVAYMQDFNYVRAEEECREAMVLAEKLRDKEKIRETSDYQKLIEAVIMADEIYEDGDYEEAQEAYQTAMGRSRYADSLADEYIEKKLSTIAEYLKFFDAIRLGDMMMEQEDYAGAEEKYLEAKNLATDMHDTKGRQEAVASLENLYEKRNQAEEADVQKAKERAEEEIGAASLVAAGDKAFTDEDYEGAVVYYMMALEKYQKLEDEVHIGGTQIKIDASRQKAEEVRRKEEQEKEAEIIQQEMSDRVHLSEETMKEESAR